MNRRQSPLDRRSHQIERSTLSCEHLELQYCLPHKHLDTRNRVTVAKPRLLDKHGLFGSVNAFHHEEARFQEAAMNRALIEIGMHPKGCAVNEQVTNNGVPGAPVNRTARHLLSQT